jgi:hypothetical protein
VAKRFAKIVQVGFFHAPPRCPGKWAQRGKAVSDAVLQLHHGVSRDKGNHFELVESHEDLRVGSHAGLDWSFAALCK